MQLVRLSAGVNFEDLAAKAKAVGRLTTDFGNETCVVCCNKGRQDWQVTLFDALGVSYVDHAVRSFPKN